MDASLFGCVVTLYLYLMLNFVISSLIFVTFKSPCMTLLDVYHGACMRVGTLIVATIYLQLIKNRYMFRSFSVLQCSHQQCVQPVASDVEVIGYL